MADARKRRTSNVPQLIIVIGFGQGLMNPILTEREGRSTRNNPSQGREGAALGPYFHLL